MEASEDGPRLGRPTLREGWSKRTVASALMPCVAITALVPCAWRCVRTEFEMRVSSGRAAIIAVAHLGCTGLFSLGGKASSRLASFVYALAGSHWR